MQVLWNRGEMQFSCYGSYPVATTVLVQQRHYILNLPELLSDSGCLRGTSAQRLMNAGEVVMHIV